MFKKVFAALVVSSVAFVATPAFSATQAEVVSSCGAGSCAGAVKAYLDSLTGPAKVSAARNLAAALAQAGLSAGAKKTNYVDGLKAAADAVKCIGGGGTCDDALSQQVAQLSDSLASNNDTATAATGVANNDAASAN